MRFHALSFLSIKVFTLFQLEFHISYFYIDWFQQSAGCNVDDALEMEEKGTCHSCALSYKIKMIILRVWFDCFIRAI